MCSPTSPPPKTIHCDFKGHKTTTGAKSPLTVVNLELGALQEPISSSLTLEAALRSHFHSISLEEGEDTYGGEGEDMITPLGQFAQNVGVLRSFFLDLKVEHGKGRWPVKRCVHTGCVGTPL